MTVSFFVAPEPPHMYGVAGLYGLVALACARLIATFRDEAARYVFVALNFTAATVFLAAEGPQTGHIGIYFIAVILAGLILRPWAALVAGIGGAVAVSAAYFASSSGWQPLSPAEGTEGLWLKQVSQLLAAGILTAIATASLHRTLSALQQSQLDVATLIDESPDGILILDKEANAQLINATARELLVDSKEGSHIDLSRLEGTAPGDVVHLDTATGVRAVSIRRREREDGTLITLRDVTEEVASDDKRRATAQRVQRAEKLEALGRLAGGVAHDFNNLLTVIIASAEFLKATTSEAERAELIGSITTASHTAAGITRQLLSFGRPNPGATSQVDLGESLRRLGKLLRRTLGDQVNLIIEAEAPLLIEAIPSEIDQVVVNLAVNAADAMVTGGVVRMSAATVGEEAQLIVTDEGEGIPQSQLGAIFEPYFTTKASEGTGIGLSVVHRIVTASGGRVEVTSTVGVGTSFVLRWPLSTGSSAEPDGGPAGAPLATEGPPKTVLLVDDNEAIRDVVARSLRGMGYETHVAATMEEVSAVLLEVDALDALVTDVLLGVRIDGVQVASLVRERFPNVPVLYISGYTGGHLRQAGITDEHALLTKPFTRSQLARALARVVGSAAGGRTTSPGEASTKRADQPSP